MYDNPWVIDGLWVEVEDVDAHRARAEEEGATIVRDIDEPGIGYRIYTAEDIEGHRWMFGQRLQATAPSTPTRGGGSSADSSSASSNGG
jgi:hypothetical protein